MSVIAVTNKIVTVSTQKIVICELQHGLQPASCTFPWSFVNANIFNEAALSMIRYLITENCDNFLRKGFGEVKYFENYNLYETGCALHWSETVARRGAECSRTGKLCIKSKQFNFQLYVSYERLKIEWEFFGT